MKYKYETHMHTAEVSACAVKFAAQQVAAYKDRGYAGIIITDHFVNGYTTCPKDLSWEKRMRFFVSGYEEAKKMGEKIDLDVFLGWEFTIKGSDFLTYGLDLGFLLDNPNVDKYSIEDYSELVRENGGFLAQAHPFRDEYYIENPYPAKPHLIDAVEVFNVMDRETSNEKALIFAEDNNLPMQAGTDDHGRGNNSYSGIVLNKRAESIYDIINAIKAKDVGLIAPQYYFQ